MAVREAEPVGSLSEVKEAGLDPEQPPTTLEEMAEHARAIRELGGDTYGTFWGGDCGGCYVFTYWPSIWAAGGEVMNEDGTESTINSPEAIEVFETYRSLWEDDVVEPTAINEPGDQWTGFFPEGSIGVMPMPSTTLGTVSEALGDDVVGVAPIPGVDGGESTFVGGDSIGISATAAIHPRKRPSRPSRSSSAAWASAARRSTRRRSSTSTRLGRSTST